MHSNEWCVPFSWRAKLYVISVNWRIRAARLGKFGGFDLKLSYLWYMLWFPFAQEAVSPGYAMADPHCHLQGSIFWEVCYMPCWNQSVTAAELFPLILPDWTWQWCLHPGKGPEGWSKIRVTFFFFWHVKISHFFFSTRLFLIHTSMKNGLTGIFFSTSSSSPFLLWV